MLVLPALGISALAVVAHAATPSPGCGGALPDGQEPGGTYDGSVDDRQHLVFIPPEYSTDAPAAVVLSYHGGSKIPDEQLGLDQFTNPDYNTNKIIVYPAGTPQDDCEGDDCTNKLYWDVDPDIHADDVQYTKDLLDALGDTYCLDTDRLFATGKSQGAGFAGQRAACDPDLSTRFAAFAPVSGAFYVDTDCADPATIEIPCSPGRPDVPVIEFHGGQDDTASYDGGERKGQCLPAIRHWVDEWAARDGLAADPEEGPLSDEAPDTTLFKYGGGLVSHVFAPDVAHDWPSRTENDDNADSAPAEYDATPMILQFFDDHPLKA